MPSFADSIFLFVLALLLFGPKRLPVLARELGKWIGEFRRASNEFKMQMEDELRASEQADRQKQIAAMEAAAPLPPPLEEPEHPHLRNTIAPSSAASEAVAPAATLPDALPISEDRHPERTGVPGELARWGESEGPPSSADVAHDPQVVPTLSSAPAPVEILDGVRPLPIATSGNLHMMPPATGLPTPRARNGNGSANGNPLGGLLDAIPETDAPAPLTAENALHGD